MLNLGGNNQKLTGHEAHEEVESLLWAPRWTTQRVMRRSVDQPSLAAGLGVLWVLREVVDPFDASRGGERERVKSLTVEIAIVYVAGCYANAGNDVKSGSFRSPACDTA
jgi:hypothetical protein